MDVSPNVLRKEAVANLKEIDAAISDMRRGPFSAYKPEVMSTLLAAKATALNTLTLLRTQ